MTLQELVERGLKEMGADGLLNDDYECGCEIGDLAPCESPCFTDCKPGRLVQCESQSPHEHPEDDGPDPDTCWEKDGKFYRMMEVKP